MSVHQEGHLTAKGTDKASTGLITLTGTMDTAAGNDYMGKEAQEHHHHRDGYAGHRRERQLQQQIR